MRIYFDPSLLIHVAVAAISGLGDFATLDVGQAGLAQAAGLTVVQLPA